MQIRRSLFSFAFAMSICLTSSFVAQATAAPTKGGPGLTHTAMVTNETGWGTTDSRVLWTTNGGRTWQTMLSVPKLSPFPNEGQHFVFAPVGQDDAWAVTATNHGLRTYRTQDAGTTWAQTQLRLGGSQHASSPGGLTFADSTHGWLLLHDGVAAGSAPNAILRTADGGHHWSLVEFNDLAGHSSPMSLPACDGAVSYLSFVNSTTGWSTGTCGAGPQIEEVFRTHNGGRTWHQEAVPTPGFKRTYFAAGSVIPVGVHRLLLLPVSLATPSAFLLYRSIDGSLSWKPTTPIWVRSPYSYLGPQFTFEALNNLVCWVAIGNALRRTTNGGIKWYGMSSHLPFRTPTQLDFVNKHDGFALSFLVGGASRMYATTDSGRHWYKV